MDLRVTLEDLVISGTVVTRHGEDTAARHAAADDRIENAQWGWQGLSALAMSARVEQWRLTTSTLVANMSEHAQGLHGSARGFAEMDSSNSQRIDALAPGRNPT